MPVSTLNGFVRTLLKRAHEVVTVELGVTEIPKLVLARHLVEILEVHDLRNM
jgi:hypothetical protein